MPLHLNPSLTGHIPGTYRVKAIYRNQWASITQGGVYSTPGASFDMNFRQGESRNSIGGGIAFLNDQSGGGDFTNMVVLASAAYHMSLDKKQKSFISLGVQGGFLSKRVDQESMIFESQFDPSGNPVQGSNENFADTNVSGGDLRAGLTFSSYPSDKMNYKLGFAYMHLLQTKEQFLTGASENTLPSRMGAFAQAEIKMKNPKLRLMPEFMFMNQAGVNEINVTANMGYEINGQFDLLFGAGYRVQDAAIAIIGFEYKGVELMASYDINLSDLSPASRYQGGFEISVGYIGQIKKPVEAELPCVRFF
jgi:type IX secretion system PorP/SprF family membrane protein